MSGFTEEQLETLILSVVKGTPGITEDKIQEFVDWCQGAIINHGIVQAILLDSIIVTYAGPEDFTMKIEKD